MSSLLHSYPLFLALTIALLATVALLSACASRFDLDDVEERRPAIGVAILWIIAVFAAVFTEAHLYELGRPGFLVTALTVCVIFYAVGRAFDFLDGIEGYPSDDDDLDDDFEEDYEEHDEPFRH